MTSDQIPVDAVPPLALLIPLSLQHLFAMFGATVLVPVLLGINPATVLLFNGIGTLIFLAICKWKVPAYLGSSFAYIAPSLIIIGSYGYGAALSGYIVTGLLFLLSALIIYRFGTGWVKILFPDVVMGSVVAVIGLALAPTAAKLSGLIEQGRDEVRPAGAAGSWKDWLVGEREWRGEASALEPLLEGWGDQPRDEVWFNMATKLAICRLRATPADPRKAEKLLCAAEELARQWIGARDYEERALWYGGLADVMESAGRLEVRRQEFRERQSEAQKGIRPKAE